MVRLLYEPEDFGIEVVAPSGYYLPIGQETIERDGRRLLYVLGNYCIEASCCGVGSWNYLRVEGYVIEGDDPGSGGESGPIEIDTIENESERAAISSLLLQQHPGVRIEFR